MFNWIIERLIEIFKGEWKIIGKFEGKCRVRDIFHSPRESVKSDAIIVIKEHSITGNRKGYIEIPTGTRQSLGSSYVEHIYEKRIKS